MSSITNISYSEKAKAYFDLTKFRLSITVVFSSCFGYAIAATHINYFYLLLFAVASFLITASANTINQIKEVELDKLMTRTQDRPLPSGRLSRNEAIGFCIISGLIGLGIIYFQFNYLAFLVSLLS